MAELPKNEPAVSSVFLFLIGVSPFCIIPFRVNELIRSTNPIKVYEYIEGGKPLVATAIPEIEDMPFVYISRNPEDFLKDLEHANLTP